MSALECPVLPDVRLDPGIGTAFRQQVPDGPYQSRLDPQGEREPREDLIGHCFHLSVTQGRSFKGLDTFPGEDRPEPGELTAAVAGMAGHQGERRVPVGPELAAPLQPEARQPFPLILLASQAAEISQHQHDGAGIGWPIRARLPGREQGPRDRGSILEDGELEADPGIDPLELGDRKVLIQPERRRVAGCDRR